MAEYRLAMVACLDAVEGPWTFAKGNESGIEIVHLLEGERIRMDLDYEGALAHLEFETPGAFPLVVAAGFRRYRVCKLSDEGVPKSPTTVKVKLNGAA